MAKSQFMNLNSQFRKVNILRKLDWMLFKDPKQLDDPQVLECNSDYNIFGGNKIMAIFKTFYPPPHFLFNLTFRTIVSIPSDFMIVTTLDNFLYRVNQSASNYEPCISGDLYSNGQFESFQNWHFTSTIQVQIILTEYQVFAGEIDRPPQCEACYLGGYCLQMTQFSIYFWVQDIQQIEGWQKKIYLFEESKNVAISNFWAF